jgi:hypothetical protein
MTNSKISSLEFRGHVFRYTDIELKISGAVTHALLEVLHNWQTCVPYEPTLVMRQYGVPCLVVRFDCTISPSGKVSIYEIQEGCSGLGYAGIVNPEFRKLRDYCKTSLWPEFKVIISESSNDDDPLWLEPISLEEAFSTNVALMMRYSVSDPSEIRRLEPLIARAIRPVVTHNDKTYGIKLGLWQPIRWSQFPDSLPWHESFVLKPLRKSGSRDVVIWRHDNARGGATKSQIKRVLQENQWMYIQKFAEPMSITISAERYNAILRPFFGYDIAAKQWIPLHGMWIARPYPNLRIHGSADAVSGPLMVSMEDR